MHSSILHRSPLLLSFLFLFSCTSDPDRNTKTVVTDTTKSETLQAASPEKDDRAVRVLDREELESEFGNADSTGYSELPLYRAYTYGDKGGYHIVLLCEAPYNKRDKDTLHDRLEAIGLLHDHGGHVVQWRIRDLRERSEQEEDIHFWTRYCRFGDLDGDGYAEPLIVYGSYANEEVRRLKIIAVYKKKKYAVRAVECVLDDCRTLQYDASFSTLPKAVRDTVESVMERLRQDHGLLLKDG